MTPEEYDELCSAAVSAAQLIWNDYGQPVWEDLYADPETERLLEAGRKYADAVYGSLDENHSTDLPLLPPEYAFPEFGAPSLFWRMGNGEFFAMLYRKYYNRLSPEEKAEHCVRYPIPYYMDEEKQDDIDDMKDLGPEFVEFRFYSPVLAASFEVRSHYYAFAALPDSEKAREIRNIKMGLACSNAYEPFKEQKEIADGVFLSDLFPQNKPLADEYQSYVRRIADSMELTDIRSAVSDQAGC